MADLRITGLPTITTVTDAAVAAFDNTAGTNETEKITYANLEAQIRAGASDADLARLAGISASNSELNILDGALLSTSELNKLDGFTGDKYDLNKLDGFTGTTADLELLEPVESALMGKDENQAGHGGTITSSGIITTGSGNYPTDTSSAAVLITLPTITKGKSEEIVLLISDGGNNLTITKGSYDAGFVSSDGATNGTLLTLSDVDDFVYLKSSSIVEGYWMILGGNGYTLT